MSRQCSQCNYWKEGEDFSNNQWRKGDGWSRCRSCVEGYYCDICDREFNHPNQLEMHMQTHRPRNVSCPICHETRFRSGANAVQHVESGYCPGCQGKDYARDEIYKFACSQRSMQRYLADPPRLTWYGDIIDDGTPDYPYTCPECDRYFQQLSQLLQHRDNRHGSAPLRLQNF